MLNYIDRQILFHDECRIHFSCPVYECYNQIKPFLIIGSPFKLFPEGIKLKLTIRLFFHFSDEVECVICSKILEEVINFIVIQVAG